MWQRIRNFFNVGMRTWKTVIAVAIAAGLMTLFNETPFFACIGAVVGVGRTRKSSFEDALVRNLGTAVGGFVGIAMVYLTDNVLIEALGVIPIVLIISHLNKKPSIVPGCIVYFATVYLMTPDTASIYAVRRVFETFIGTLIGIGVNFLIKSPDDEEEFQPM